MFRTHPHRLIGLAVTHGFSYYRHILRGIGAFAEQHPDWELVSLAPEMGRKVPLVAGSVDGIVASCGTPWLVKYFTRWKKPVVNVDAVYPGVPLPRVGVDNVAIANLAAEHFFERGLKHFAFVGHPDWMYSREREVAFQRVVEDAGSSVSVYHCRTRSDFDPLGRVWHLERNAERWLARLPKPIGIFTPNDLWGLQVAEVCLRMGVQIPEEVAILGTDNDDLYCELSRPSLSSVIVPAEQIGYTAASILDRMIDGRPRPREAILLPPPGVEVRQSTDVLAIDDQHVVRAIRFIRENTHRALRVADVLKLVPLSRSVLERRVKTALGRTLGDEIRRTRLQRALQLLVSSDLPIAKVATHAGFSDFRHLAVTVRKEIGVTPTEYRIQHRKIERT